MFARQVRAAERCEFGIVERVCRMRVFCGNGAVLGLAAVTTVPDIVDVGEAVVLADIHRNEQYT